MSKSTKNYPTMCVGLQTKNPANGQVETIKLTFSLIIGYGILGNKKETIDLGWIDRQSRCLKNSYAPTYEKLLY